MTLPQNVIHVGQGDIVATNDPTVIYSTVLGSCVSTCIYDPQTKFGGMIHYLLPYAPPTGDPKRAGMHAPTALAGLIDKILLSGAHRSDLQAKIFGGGAVVAGLGDIGQNNIEAAKEFLSHAKIPIVGSCVGGSSARRIKFTPATGLVRRILYANIKNDEPRDPDIKPI